MRPAHKALACWVGGAVVYNVLTRDGETISEGIDELLERYPLLTRVAIMTVTHHLLNELTADPVSLGFGALRGALRRRRLVVVVESEPMSHSAE